jgi:hypothetical protein
MLITTLFTGCATNVAPSANTQYISEPKRTLETNKIIEKNYNLNTIKKSYVGDIVVEKGEWNINDIYTEQTTSIEDISAQPLEDIDIGGLYPVIKSNNRIIAHAIGDGKYSVPYLNLSGQIVGNIIVSNTGEIVDIDGPGTFAWSKMEVPENLKSKKSFNIIDKSRTDISKEKQSQTTKGFSFQLIYAGLNNDNKNILLTYREFVDDKIRPAYSEKFSYAKSDKFLRFKTVKIEVLEATSEFLLYKVIEE